MSKYNLYLVEITEPTSSDEVLRVRVMIENGHDVYYSGDQAEAVLDILKGKCQMITDSAIRETLRERDEMIKVLKQQIEEKQDQIDILNGQIGEYKNTNVRLRREKENQRDIIRECREERETLLRKCDNQKKTIVEQLEVIETLKEKNAWIIKENSNTALCEKLEKADARNSELMDEIDILRAELKDDLKRRTILAHKEAEIDGLKAINDELSRENKNQIKELQDMYNAQCKVVKDQAEKIEELNGTIDDLVMYCSETRRNLEETIKDRERVIGSKNEEIRHLKETHYIQFDVTSTEKVKCYIDNFKLRNENKKLKESFKRLAEASKDASVSLSEAAKCINSIKFN